LYLVRANQLAAASAAKIRALTLLIYTDRLIFPQPLIERTAADLREAGTFVRMESLQGRNGHLNEILRIEQAGAAIAEFIARD